MTQFMGVLTDPSIDGPWRSRVDLECIAIRRGRERR